MTSQFLAAAAAVGLIGAGVAGASETRSFEAMTSQVAMFGNGEGGGASGGTCRVDVVRTGPAGSADVTRQTFTDGSCVCTVTTGPASSNGAAENVVANVLRDRTCGDPVAGGEEAAGSGGGMGGGAIVGVLFGVGALAVGVAAGGSDSPG